MARLMSSAVADSCKADPAEGDCLQFYIDGVLKDAIDGEVDWVQKSYEITSSGTHSLLWQYTKDDSGDDGEDCGWVDYLQWDGSAEPPPR